MIDLDKFCTVVRQELMNLAGNNYPAMQRQPVGLLDAVNSDVNKSGVEMYAVDGNDGKNKQVLVEFIQPGLVSEMGSARRNVCDAGTEETNSQYLFNISCAASSPIMQWSKDELRDYCESPNEVKTRRIASKMSGLFKSINQQLVTKYLASYGTFFDGAVLATPKPITMLRTAGTGQIQADPAGEIEMRRDYRDLTLNSGMINVGGGNLYDYAQYKDIACCNDYGQDLNRLGDFLYYLDHDVETLALDTNDFISFHPGAVQFLTWNANKGEFAGPNTAQEIETTYVDPVTGIELDWDIQYDFCNKVFKMVFNLDFDLAFMPDEIYAAADPRFGVNNTFMYRATLA